MQLLANTHTHTHTLTYTHIHTHHTKVLDYSPRFLPSPSLGRILLLLLLLLLIEAELEDCVLDLGVVVKMGEEEAEVTRTVLLVFAASSCEK